MCRVISPQPSAGVSCIYLLVTTKRRCDMSPSSSLPTESHPTLLASKHSASERHKTYCPVSVPYFCAICLRVRCSPAYGAMRAFLARRFVAYRPNPAFWICDGLTRNPCCCCACCQHTGPRHVRFRHRVPADVVAVHWLQVRTD